MTDTGDFFLFFPFFFLFLSLSLTFRHASLQSLCGGQNGERERKKNEACTEMAPCGIVSGGGRTQHTLACFLTITNKREDDGKPKKRKGAKSMYAWEGKASPLVYSYAFLSVSCSQACLYALRRLNR